jgi:hypothetical protein
MKKLVYKIQLVIDPAKVDMVAVLTALEPFGDAEVLGFVTRKFED